MAVVVKVCLFLNAHLSPFLVQTNFFWYRLPARLAPADRFRILETQIANLTVKFVTLGHFSKIGF